MRKVFWKKLIQVMCLGLSLTSGVAFGAYNDDPDCAAVSNGARASVDRTTEIIDQGARTVGSAVEQAKTCVDALTSAATRSISDFGGGIQIPDLLRQSLAQQACKVLSSTQTKLTSTIKGQVNSAVGSAIQIAPTYVQPALQSGVNVISNSDQRVPSAPKPAQAVPQSLYQRLANIF